MKKIISIIMIAGIVVFLSGCVSFNSYMVDRGNDFLDCFKADVGVGLGLDVHVLCTDAISTGAGFAMTWKAGFKGRNFGKWMDVHIGLPISLGGWFNENNNNFPISDYFITGMDGWIFYKNAVDGAYETDAIILFNINKNNRPEDTQEGLPFNDLVNAFDVEAGLTVICVGVRVGFSFVQFADFITGWFGPDIAGDDKY